MGEPATQGMRATTHRLPQRFRSALVIGGAGGGLGAGLGFCFGGVIGGGVGGGLGALAGQLVGLVLGKRLGERALARIEHTWRAVALALSALLTTASFIAFLRTRELVWLLGFFLFGGCTVYAQRRRRSQSAD